MNEGSFLLSWGIQLLRSAANAFLIWFKKLLDCFCGPEVFTANAGL